MLADLKIAARSLLRTRGLALTVTITLALGIGANAAMFTVVRGVLLRPLVNRDESRLIYIRQSAPGAEIENATFSVPEIDDLHARMKTVSAIGDFSVIGFSMTGLGEPRVLRAGVVSGEFFKVMGLRAIRGRLIDVADDGPTAAPVVVLTHRFWTTTLGSDSTVIGKQVRLNGGQDRLATIIGILEPSVPYPTETEIIANVVTSPHHMGAVMNTSRTHRMTEIFARLAPGATIEQAQAELTTIEKGLIKAYPEAYPASSNYQLETRLLRDQIVSRARTILWVLLASSALIFIIACSNVANLILARSVQREAELSLRAALGATAAGLRRTLLAESLLLGGTGAVLGVLLAVWMVPVLSRYAARYSIRALELSVDPTVLWVGVTLALIAAVLLAFIPRLPTADTAGGLGGAAAGMRMTTSTGHRLRAFAVTQVGASFVLLAGASMLLTTLITLQRAPTPFETADVLAINVPVIRHAGRSQLQTGAFYRDVVRQVEQLPGVEHAAVGQTVPWRDAGNTVQPVHFTVSGYAKAGNEEDPTARYRTVGPGWFETVGLRLVAGRDFTQADADSGAARTMVVSQSVAQQMSPSIQGIVGKNLTITDTTLRPFLNPNNEPIQIIGVVADVDDENVIPQQAMTMYTPGFGGRLFVRSRAKDPYALLPAITKLIRQQAPDQPVERAATLADVKAELISPDKVNTIVFGAFALVALTIAVVGVAGVLAFSVSTRMREFGIRLAVGSEPVQLMTSVLRQGAGIGAMGILVGGASGLVLARIGSAVFGNMRMPGLVPVLGAGLLLLIAATLASWMPAARASRVDVLQALRSD
jgi:predicted permease